MNHRLNDLKRVFSVHSFPTALKVFFTFFYNRMMGLLRINPKNSQITKKTDENFDQKWEVDTSGILISDKTDIVGNNWFHGQKYQGCDPDILQELLNKLTINYENFTFLDLGSGKGHALLIASTFPFNKIIGVEYSRQFTEIALKNIQQFNDEEKRCKKIEAICMDASLFPIPTDPLVIFMNNPFGKKVMTEVVKNVTNSFQQNKRPIIVIYFYAEFAHLWRHNKINKETRISKNDTLFIFDDQNAAFPEYLWNPDGISKVPGKIS